MSYDPIGDLYTGSPGARVNQGLINKALRENEEAERIRRRQEQTAREAERVRKEREKLRIQRTKYAGDKLRVPGVLRNAPEPEWQLQQWAAGYTSAPPKPPIDWDRMNYAEREKLRKYWR
jgi:hypothetical protein